MASIRERNGSYQIIVSLGRDHEGKQLFERITYIPTSTTPKKIENEVNEFAREFEKRVKEGKYLSGEKITFSEVCKLWEESEDATSLTQNVLIGYKAILKNHAIPNLGKMKMAKIKVPHLEKIYKQLKDEGRAAATIRRIHVVINAIFKYALRCDIVHENICDRVRLPKLNNGLKKEKEKLQYFTLNQAKTFMTALDKEYELETHGHSRTLNSSGCSYYVNDYSSKHRVSTQYKVYFNLAIIGGFRRGELIALTWADIDFDQKTISINKAASRLSKKNGGQILKETKTKASNRTIKMPGQCFELLREWKLEELELSFALGSKWEGYRGKDFDKNHIFIQLDSGRMMDLDSPYHVLKRTIELHNNTCINEEDKLPNIRLHDLRHTSATLLISAKEDIETISHRLGHSKASVTMDVYGHWMKETDEKAADTMGRLFSSAK